MLEKALFRWTSFVIAHSVAVIIALSLITAAAAYIAIARFEMNSNTGELIRQDTDWKRTHNEFIATFPQYNQNSFVVVSGTRPDEVRQVTMAVRDEIAKNEIYSSVYAPGVTPFAEQHALLYLDAERLNDIVSRLADAQPFLAAIASDSTLRGIINLLRDAFTSTEPLPAGLSQISDSLNRAAEQSLAGDTRPIAWRDELFQVDGDSTFYQVVFVKGRQDFGVQLPNRDIVHGLNTAIADFSHAYKNDVTIRVSGQVPLEHGEIESAVSSAQFAGTLALVLLVGILVIGVRSLRIITATYLSMLMGLIWTAAFAMLAVGQYNTISIIFLVMFIGLGVDFAVHLCLRYQEATSKEGKHEALIDMSVSLGPAIMLCGVTSAIGFLSFAPTDYIGVAEMGIISGGGMIIAVIVSLTLIPAFFAVTKVPSPAAPLPFSTSLSTTLASKPERVAYATLAFAVILAIGASQARFDYSTLAIKNPDSEAMTTLKELISEDIITDFALTYVADTEAQAEAIKQELGALNTVSEVLVPADYVPADQDEKLYILEDAGFLLDGLFISEASAEPLTDETLIAMLQQLAGDIESRLARGDVSDELTDSLTSLATLLSQLAEAPETARELMHNLVMPPVQAELAWLERALAVESITFRDLPADLQARLITDDGKTLLSITPAEDVLPVEALRRFTTDVLNVAPNATGRPVLDLGIGEIVLHAFSIALATAITVIFVILLFTLRSVVDSILVFIPLVMTAMLTLAFGVLIDLPLNMANLVVIPLIFGLGVDNGIHIVKRFRQSNSVSDLVASSTPKAVFLSNLTTLGTFSALSVSTHQGIFSIGVLLTVAIISLMILTLISLPALLATFSRSATDLTPQTV